jgi:hypothetical protein
VLDALNNAMLDALAKTILTSFPHSFAKTVLQTRKKPLVAAKGGRKNKTKPNKTKQNKTKQKHARYRQSGWFRV